MSDRINVVIPNEKPVIIRAPENGQDGKGLLPKGEWSSDQEYHYLDLVTYQNGSYIATSITVPVGAVPTNTVYWQLNSAAGSTSWNAIIDKPETFPPSTHDHNDLYYTETETDALFLTKANANDVYTKIETDDLLDGIQEQIDDINKFAIHVCTSGEYDPTTLVPTVSNPKANTFYLVPSGTANDMYDEWIYVDNQWEKFGSARIDLSSYYTKSETDSLLDDKADSDDVYTKLETDSLLADKADSDDVYTKAETDSLLDRKLDAHTTEMSGGVITFEAENTSAIRELSVDIEPVQDLNGYDNPWPAGGGTNLWGDIKLATDINTAITSTLDTTAKTISWESIAGRDMSVLSGNLLFKENTQYTLILDGTGTGTSNFVNLMFKYTDGTTSRDENITLKIGANVTTAGKTLESIIARQYSGTTTLNYEKCGLFEGAKTASDFTPWENVCPINGHTSTTITRTGKNLLKFAFEDMSQTKSGYGVTANYSADTDIITIVGNSTGTVNVGYMSHHPDYLLDCLEVGKTYTLAADFSDPRIYLQLNIGKTGSGLAASARIDKNSSTYTFTMIYEPISVTLYAGVYADAGTLDATITNIQLELGSTATAYESYQGTSVTIDLDGTCYGGSVDVKTGVLTVDRAIATFDGTENYDNSYFPHVLCKKKLNPVGNIAKKNEIKCNYTAVPNISFANNSANTIDWLHADTIFGVSDADEFKALISQYYASGKPMTVVYPLAEPITYTLTPAQISTLIGTNHVFADTGDLNAVIQLSAGDLAFQDVIDYESDQIINKPSVLSADLIANVESAMKATRNYAVGALVLVSSTNKLYRVTSAISSGGTIAVGSNVVQTTVEAELALRAKSADVYTKTQVDGLLADKADSDDVYTKLETDSLLDRKLDSKDTEMSGGIITFEAENTSSIRGITVPLEPVQHNDYDSVWPGGGGKNLVDVTSPQTITSQTELARISTSEQTQFTVSATIVNNASINGALNIYAYNGNTLVLSKQTVVPASASSARYSATIDLSSVEYTNLRIAISGASSGYSLTVSAVQLEKGSTATAFAPYENVCPISGHTGVSITRTGKNLWNKTLIDGYVEITDLLKAGQTYTVSAKRINEEQPTYFYVYAGENHDILIGYVIAGSNIPNRTFTVDQREKYWAYSNSSYVNVKDIQLELGSTATDYEPYQGQQISIDWQTEAGTVYGGTLDAKTGVLTVDYGLVEYDGSNDEDWRLYTAFNGYYIIKNDMMVGTRQNGLSNWLIQNKIYTLGFWLGVSSNFIYIVHTENILGEDRTVEAWRSYLADNPLQIVYPLASPQTYQLTPQQLTTLHGINNVWADAGNITAKIQMQTGALAYQDTIDYESDQLTNKPFVLNGGTIANLETQMKATKNYTSGDLILVSGTNKLYRATTNIAANANLTVSGNVVETTVDKEIALRAKSADVYTKTQVDTALSAKANTADVYTQDETDTLLTDKATVITEVASGAIVRIEDGAAATVTSLTVGIDPIQDLNGYDHPWPAGGGKNLLNIPDVAETVASGVTQKIENGHITASGTNTNGYSFYLIVSESNWYLDAGTYTLSFTGTREGYNALYVRDLDNLVTMAALNPNQSSTTFTVSERTHVILYFNASSADRTISVNGYAQLEEGSAATAYAPYSNICPISGHTGVNITRTGKNLFAGYGERTYIKPDTWYVFSSDTLPNSGTSRIRFSMYDKNGTVITGASTAQGSDWYVASNQIGNNTGNLTSLLNRKLCITGAPNLAYIVFLDDSSTAYGYVNFTNIQMELGSTATDYEPYTAQQISVDWQTEAGTVYGAMLDVKTGILTVNRECTILDGVTNAITHLYSPDDSYTYLAGLPCARVYTSKPVYNSTPICSHFQGLRYQTRRNATANMIFHYSTASNTPFAFYIEGYTTTAEYNNWLIAQNQAGTPLTIVTEISTPLTYQLTPAQLTTLLGINNIFSDTGDVSVEYRADTKLYIQRLTKPTEDDLVANVNIAAGKFFMVGNSLYLSTTAISAGETIIIGSNCTALSLADALNQLNQ